MTLDFGHRALFLIHPDEVRENGTCSQQGSARKACPDIWVHGIPMPKKNISNISWLGNTWRKFGDEMNLLFFFGHFIPFSNAKEVGGSQLDPGSSFGSAQVRADLFWFPYVSMYPPAIKHDNRIYPPYILCPMMPFNGAFPIAISWYCGWGSRFTTWHWKAFTFAGRLVFVFLCGYWLVVDLPLWKIWVRQLVNSD